MNSLSRAASAVLALMPAPALAQSAVVIWPVDPRIEQGEQATAIWLENKGADPVTLQLRSFGWDQSSGTDAHVDQSTIVASPPIATVAPGERQLVRVIRRGPAASGERAYRLIIDELPRPRSETGGVSARLDVQMRYSLPLFAYDAARDTAKPALDSRVMIEDGKRWLVVRNTGNGHARLTDLTLEQRGAISPVQSGLVGYVLPGATMRWALPDTLAPASVLRAGVNGHLVVLTPAI